MSRLIPVSQIDRSARESHMRDDLAGFARAAGWHVTTEFVLDGWGRVDLVMEDHARLLLVECKLEIASRRELRRAILQAHGYARLFPETSKAPSTYVVAESLRVRNARVWGDRFDLQICDSDGFKAMIYDEAQAEFDRWRRRVVELEVLYTPPMLASPI